MVCLFAAMAAFAPRLAFLFYWIARPQIVEAAFGNWIVPLLGFIFLPFATLFYVILYTPGVGLTGADRFAIELSGNDGLDDATDEVVYGLCSMITVAPPSVVGVQS